MIRSIALCAIVLMMSSAMAFAQETPTPEAPAATQPSDKVKAAASQVQSAATQMSQQTIENFKQIKEQGVTPEMILAWICVGGFFAGVVGNLLRPPGNRIAVIFDLIIGGIGAFLGGFVVRVTGLDLGWPVVTFKSEAAALAIVFSVLLVVALKLWKKQVHVMTGGVTAVVTPKK